MTLTVRQELASHFVPELEILVDLFNELGFEVKGLLEAVIKKETADLEAVIREAAAAGGNHGQDEGGRTEAWRRMPKTLKEVRGKHFLFQNRCMINYISQILQKKDINYLNKFHRHLTLLFSYLVQEK
jgi:hypothetical protein